jgi:hypothetical protein
MMSGTKNQRKIRRATLVELAQNLCMVIERGELTPEESLQVLAGLQALLELLSVPPRELQH